MNERVRLFKAARKEKDAAYKRTIELMNHMVDNDLFHDKKLMAELHDVMHTYDVMKCVMKTCRKEVDKNVISYRFR
jgi:hypothetical protein